MSTIERKKLVAKLKVWRKTKGLTQEQLAHQIGICFATLNRWETGKTLPSGMACRALETMMTVPGNEIRIERRSFGNLEEEPT
jgi:putative transcriptional regulator